MNDIILESQRLILRYQRDSDLDFLVELWTNETVTKYVGGPRNKKTLTDGFMENSADPRREEFDLWYVESKNTHELIGMAGLLRKKIDEQEFYEINYYIRPDQWNKGYASEIAKAIIAHFQTVYKIKTYIAIIDRENTASVKTAVKTGMGYWKTVVRSSGEKEIYRGDFGA